MEDSGATSCHVHDWASRAAHRPGIMPESELKSDDCLCLILDFNIHFLSLGKISHGPKSSKVYAWTMFRLPDDIIMFEFDCGRAALPHASSLSLFFTIRS